MNSEQIDVTANPQDRAATHRGFTILHRLRAWWERQQTAQRLLAADGFERKRMSQELSMGSLDIATLSASPRSGYTLLPAMMARFGVDQALRRPSADGVMRDMRRVCATCPSKRRCVRALAAQTAAQDCRDFCLNAESLVALAAEGAPRPG